MNSSTCGYSSCANWRLPLLSMWVWSPVDFTLDIFRCTIAGCGGPRISVDESGASDPHNIIVWETARLWHSVDPTCRSSNHPDQLTNTTYRATVHWTVDLELKSHPKDVEEQEHGDGHFLSSTEAGFLAVVWTGATCLWCENYVRMGYHLFFGTWSKHHRKWRKPRKPRRVLAAEKAGCLMQTSKREAVNSSMMATGPWGWEDYTAVPGSLTQLEGALSCLEHLYRSLQTSEKCQGSNVFDCKKPCSRWNLDLVFVSCQERLRWVGVESLIYIYI